jgi:hypothetical protein
MTREIEEELSIRKESAEGYYLTILLPTATLQHIEGFRIKTRAHSHELLGLEFARYIWRLGL